MSDHVVIRDADGVENTMQAKDNTTFKTPYHAIAREDGTVPLKIVAEDAAHASGDSGIVSMAVRTDTPTDRSGTDGDYEPLQVSAGRLWVSSIITAIVPGTGATNLGKAEDAAHSSADVGVFALAVRNDTHTTSLTSADGDYSGIQVDASGKIGVRGTFAEDAAHTSADLGHFVLAVRNDVPANSLTSADGDYSAIQVDAAGKVGIRGTYAEDAAHSSGDLGVFILSVVNSTHTAALASADGDYAPIAVDTTGKVGIRGTFAEDAAHTSADLGVHVLTVRQDTAAALSGTDADYQPFITDASGRLWVNAGAVGTITPGTAATSLGKAEDAAHTSGDVGVMGLGVRNDADAALVGTDLDYVPHSHDSSGRTKCNVIEERVILDVTPVCDTSAYGAGDTLFDRITCGTVARVNGGTVVLESVTILDEDDQTAAEMDLYFLDSDVTLGTANAAPSISDANARKLVGHVNVPAASFKDLGGCKIAVIKGINLSMKCDAASQILYVAGVTAGTPTQTASGIKLKLAFRRG